MTRTAAGVTEILLLSLFLSPFGVSFASLSSKKRFLQLSARLVKERTNQNRRFKGNREESDSALATSSVPLTPTNERAIIKDGERACACEGSGKKKPSTDIRERTDKWTAAGRRRFSFFNF